jgi:hypothetical protein
MEYRRDFYGWTLDSFDKGAGDVIRLLRDYLRS